jgi:predicted nucleotidyltransferase
MRSIGALSHPPRAWLLWKKFAASTIGGDTVLNQDFKEFIQSLNNNDVHYLVIGGYAVAYHGYPRYTKDIDIWIELNAGNANKIVKALDEFGFSSLGLKADDFLGPGEVIQLGYPPNRIDIVTAPDGVDFPTCYASRISVDIDGVVVNFIDLENLKRNKLASGRKQDLADVENL